MAARARVSGQKKAMGSSQPMGKQLVQPLDVNSSIIPTNRRLKVSVYSEGCKLYRFCFYLVSADGREKWWGWKVWAQWCQDTFKYNVDQPKDAPKIPCLTPCLHADERVRSLEMVFIYFFFETLQEGSLQPH